MRKWDVCDTDKLLVAVNHLANIIWGQRNLYLVIDLNRFKVFNRIFRDVLPAHKECVVGFYGGKSRS